MTRGSSASVSGRRGLLGAGALVGAGAPLTGPRAAGAGGRGGAPGGSGSGCPRAGAALAEEPPQRGTAQRGGYEAWAEGYDRLEVGGLAEGSGLAGLRREGVSLAAGRTLEVGVGTGLNFPLYNFGPGGVSSLTGLDLSPGMLREAAGKRAGLGLEGLVDLVKGDAGALPFPDGSFDSVVCTFSLCVFPDPRAALSEMARVCRAGGRVVLVAHTASRIAPLAAYQRLTAPAARDLAKGCSPERDVPELARRAGLRVERQRGILLGTVRLLEARPARSSGARGAREAAGRGGRGEAATGAAAGGGDSSGAA